MIRNQTARLLLAATLMAVLPLQSFADPPSWAPAHGKRAKQHPYTYYPEYGFYYAPESSLWFWLEGSDWRVGASLPREYKPFASGGISIELGTDKPYQEHDLVVERYGKPKKVKGHGQGKLK